MKSTFDSGLSVQGSGDALVLVSGMDGTGKLFYRQVPLLARSYRVATYALRDTASTMDELVADLGRVVDAVAPETRRATIVGESFGGALALSFALALLPGAWLAFQGGWPIVVIGLASIAAGAAYTAGRRPVAPEAMLAAWVR